MTKVERLRRRGLVPYIYMFGGCAMLWQGRELIGKIALSDRWWISKRVLPARLQGALALFSVGGSTSLYVVRHFDYDTNRIRSFVESRRGPAVRYQRVHSAPGWTLHRTSAWLFSRRTFVEILEPALSDMQVEFFAALDEGRPVKARWVQLRGYCNFWTTLLMQIPASVARALISYWRGF